MEGAVLLEEVSRFGLPETLDEMDARNKVALSREWLGQRIIWEKAAQSGSGIKVGTRGTVTGIAADGRLLVDWDTIESDYLLDPRKDRFYEITEEEARRRSQRIKNSMYAYTQVGQRVAIDYAPKSVKLRQAGVKRGWRGEIVSFDSESWMIEVRFDKLPNSVLPVDQLIEQLHSVVQEEKMAARQKAMKRVPIKEGDRVEILSLGSDETRIAVGDQGVVERVWEDLKVDVDWDNGDNLSLLPECDTYRVIPAEDPS